MRGTSILTSLIKSQGILQPPVLTTLRCPLRMSSGTTDWNKVHAGKVAVLTAATDGIGLAVARRLAQQGAHVVLSSRKQENVDKAIGKLKSENLSVSGTVCHVGNKDDRNRLMEMALEKHGGIDYLFSNAAVLFPLGDVLDTSEEEWTETLHINVTVMFLLVKLVYPHMQKRGGGSIVMTSSTAAYTSIPSFGPYSVSKTAVSGLTKVLAPDLYLKNIRLNSLVPGVIKTNYSSFVWKNEALLEEMKQMYGFTRMGEPEECAGLVSFLFSPDASYITGESIVVGGGFRTRL